MKTNDDQLIRGNEARAWANSPAVLSFLRRQEELAVEMLLAHYGLPSGSIAPFQHGHSSTDPHPPV